MPWKRACEGLEAPLSARFSSRFHAGFTFEWPPKAGRSLSVPLRKPFVQPFRIELVLSVQAGGYGPEWLRAGGKDPAFRHRKGSFRAQKTRFEDLKRTISRWATPRFSRERSARHAEELRALHREQQMLQLESFGQPLGPSSLRLALCRAFKAF